MCLYVLKSHPISYCFCMIHSGSHQCRRCPIEFWSNPSHTACIARKVDFLSFNETMGIVLTAAAVSGAAVMTAVFVVFLHFRNTPVVRAFFDAFCTI